MTLCQVCGKEFDPEEDNQLICEECLGDGLDFGDGSLASVLPERPRRSDDESAFDKYQVDQMLRDMSLAEQLPDEELDRP